uniref:Transthyretin-like family protein n=1 Tax=Panagrellus redivivus TaxID=6233 RepID=A0A7E4ZVN5_PANRE
MFRGEVIVLFLGVCALASGWGRHWQSSGAYGVMTCNGVPVSNVLVKLYDHDTFTPDDKMAETKTDANGRFQLAGKAKEWTTINPRLNVYHDCNDRLPCQRKFTIKIDSRYVNDGEQATKLYPAGTMELSGKYPGEKRDCIH